MNSQQPHLACLAAWHALEAALVKAPGASLKWSLPRSRTACGCARLGVPSFSVQLVTVGRASTGAGAVAQTVDFTSAAVHF